MKWKLGQVLAFAHNLPTFLRNELLVAILETMVLAKGVLVSIRLIWAIELLEARPSLSRSEGLLTLGFLDHPYDGSLSHLYEGEGWTNSFLNSIL